MMLKLKFFTFNQYGGVLNSYKNGYFVDILYLGNKDVIIVNSNHLPVGHMSAYTTSKVSYSAVLCTVLWQICFCLCHYTVV